MGLIRASCAACVAGVILTLSGDAAATHSGDPFAFFEPAVTLGEADRERLDRREPIVRILPAREGELGVFVVSRLDAPPEALIAWTHAIEAFKQSPFVLAIRRFSEPPVPEDLDGLRLDDVDLEEIRACRPGRCGVKLTDKEIVSMAAVVATGGEAWTEAVQHEFRRIVLARLETYRESAEGITTSLAGYPGIEPTDSESFFYWSKERYGRAKPIVAVTHVTIIRSDAPGQPAVLVAGREVFATHYRVASLGLTAVVCDPARDVSYLVHVNRSHVDLLGGVFGGLRRIFIEGRIRSEGPGLLARARERLESGDPPP